MSSVYFRRMLLVTNASGKQSELADRSQRIRRLLLVFQSVAFDAGFLFDKRLLRQVDGLFGFLAPFEGFPA